MTVDTGYLSLLDDDDERAAVRIRVTEIRTVEYGARQSDYDALVPNATPRQIAAVDLDALETLQVRLEDLGETVSTTLKVEVVG